MEMRNWMNLFENTTAIYSALTKELAEADNPLTGFEWDCKPISASMIIKARAEKQYETMPFAQFQTRRQSAKAVLDYHVRRIAYLIDHPDRRPINLEVEPWKDDGNPRHPTVVEGYRIRVVAGNHRLAAAILRGDETITFKLDYGSPDQAALVLPSMQIGI